MFISLDVDFHSRYKHMERGFFNSGGSLGWGSNYGDVVMRDHMGILTMGKGSQEEE